MVGMITMALVGIICIVIGISNRKGNISSLHSYHRSRVQEADVLPFGRQVGLGMWIIGVALILSGILLYLAERMDRLALLWIGMGLLFGGMIVGMVISFRAMMKYNKGIF